MTHPDPLSPSALAQVPSREAVDALRDTKLRSHSFDEVRAMASLVLRIDGPAIVAAERQRLLGMTPEEVVEAAAKAMWESRELRLDGYPGTVQQWLGAESFREMVRAALPLLLAPEVAKREAAEKERDELRKVVAAENGAYILGYIDDIRALKEVIGAAHSAMKAVCPDEPEDEGVVYVCCDESGDPQIEAATLGEAITQLNEWFGAFQRVTEKKVWALEATVRKDEETMGAYRRINVEQTERATAAEAERDRLVGLTSEQVVEEAAKAEVVRLSESFREASRRAAEADDLAERLEAAERERDALRGLDDAARGENLTLRATLQAAEAEAKRLREALEDAPVLSRYHGMSGFHTDRFIADYEAWMNCRRAALGRDK